MSTDSHRCSSIVRDDVEHGFMKVFKHFPELKEDEETGGAFRPRKISSSKAPESEIRVHLKVNGSFLGRSPWSETSI